MNDLVTMVWKELIQVSNRPRFAWQKAAIAVILAAVFTLMSYDTIYSQPRTYEYMARFGRQFYFVLLAILTIVLSLTAMAFGSEIVISEAVRRRLPLLLVTPLPAPAIIGSKMVSVFGRVFMGLLISLPFVTLLQIFGGVDQQMVILGSIFVLSNIWLYGSIGVACSVLSRTVTGALARAAILTIVWNLLPLFYAIYVTVTSTTGRGGPSLTPASMFDLSPFFCWFMFVEGFYGGPMGGPGALNTMIGIHGGVNFALGALAASIAFFTFRPVAKRLVSGAPERKRRSLTPAKKKAPHVRAVDLPQTAFAKLFSRFDNCIVDKELCRWRPWRITLPLIWLFVPWVVVLLAGSFTDYPEFGNLEFESPMFIVEAGGFLLLLSLITATRIAREKEARTFQVLVLTRMGAARILTGKILAAVIEQAVPILLLFAHLVFIVWLEFPSPVDVAVKVVGFIVSILFGATLGLYFSLSSKTAAHSVIMTAIAWFLGVYASVMPIGWMVGFAGFGSDDSAVFVAVFPLVVAAVVSIVITGVMSRRQGFGPWLSMFSYASVAGMLYTGVAAMIAPTLAGQAMSYAAFLPAASLASWDSKAQGISIPYMMLPIQIGILIWMIGSILMSFEGQARREH